MGRPGLSGCGLWGAGAGLRGAWRPRCRRRRRSRRRRRRGTGSGPCRARRARGAERPGARRLQRELPERPPAMSRKKTPKRKGASGPAASALPAADGSRPARPGTARPGPQARPNGPPQPGRPSLGGGDFYDVAFKVSRPPPHASAAGGALPEPSRERSGRGCRTPRTLGGEPAGAASSSWHGAWHTHTAFRPGFQIPNSWQGLPPNATAGRAGQRVPDLAGAPSRVPNDTAPAPARGPVSPFPICCLPHPQGLWVFSFWRTGEIKKRFASRVGSTRAFFSPGQEPVNRGGVVRTVFGFGAWGSRLGEGRRGEA